MTLIVTSLADDAVIQVSDRRLTYADHSVASEHANKAVCVECADAVFTTAYTGLAHIGKLQTDHWLLDHLTKSKAVKKRFPDVLDGLQAHAANTFSKLCGLGKRRGITFVFAGFGPPGCFAAHLSNQEDSAGRWLKNINDAFDSGVLIRNEKRMRKLDLIIHGAEKAITPGLKAAIPKIRRRYFRLSPQERVAAFVEMLRRASKHPAHGWPIGRDCMSTILRFGDGFLTQYHPENADPISYMPHYIGPHFSARDIWVSTDPKATRWNFSQGNDDSD